MSSNPVETQGTPAAVEAHVPTSDATPASAPTSAPSAAADASANSTNEKKTKRILHVVSNVNKYDGEADHPTGLWISELSHAYDVFAAKGYEQTIVSPRGGKSPLEPKSLKWPMHDASSKAFLGDAKQKALLESTVKPEDVEASKYDAIYFTGGHAVMFDFPDNEGLQRITREIWENGGVVSSVCHGYCGLLNVKLSNGENLVKGRRLTGFSWLEEVLAGVSKQVPYNSEQEMRNRGALYEKNMLPFTSRATVDDRLVTGQNPQSAKATAKEVVAILEKKQ